ncbi:MAG TPA: thiamine phosphate synthase [Chthoniobacterales bacterium]|nr:thiamine phosphate synthase [Chthoniobacterales bacterium]
MTAADLSRSRLYGILDLGYVEIRDCGKMAEAMIAGGVDLIQLRAKELASAQIAEIAADLHRLTVERGVPLIINDHPEVARVISAEGAHLGQDDMPIAEAREVAGADCMVGKSTHSVDQAIRAFYEGADYIGFGPIFATPTKPDYPAVGLDEIQKVHDAVRIPIFCIGGIKLDNLPRVLAAGARRVVIVSGLLQAHDAAEYARSAKKALCAHPLTCDL